MGAVEKRIQEVASRQRFLITMDEVCDLGGSRHLIDNRVSRGLWRRVHAGVYQIDGRALDWETHLQAAVLACGPNALVSHRAALVLWGLDGISRAPIELTVPYDSRPIPDGVIVHRTRRSQQPAEARGIAVTTVERTLLGCSAQLPAIVVGKALDSAIRKGLTDVDRCYDLLVGKGAGASKEPGGSDGC